MRPTRASQGACILRRPPNVMHAYTILHMPIRVVHASFFQTHLQLEVLLPHEPMLGVLFLQGLMNTSGLHDEEADQEDASHPRLVQFNMTLLFPRCLTFGIT